MSDIDSKHVLRLIVDNQISHPAVVKELLESSAKEILGDSAAALIIDNQESNDNLRKIAGDLLMACSNKKNSLDDVMVGFNEQELKDRISRVFMSSQAFKLCLIVLAIGTTLFGINIGVLTLDTSAVHRVRAEAEQASNEAKAQADNAVNAIAAAISSVQTKVPELAANRIDNQQLQDNVAKILADRIHSKISEANDQVRKLSDSISAQEKNLDMGVQKLAKLQDGMEKQNETYIQAQQLFERWRSAVEVANNTTADQTLARSVWLALRNDAFLLVGSTTFSLIAVVLSALSFFRRRPGVG